jgi:hypothetical protein
LPLLLCDAGIEDVAMKVAQPAGIHGDILQIAPLTLRNTRQPIIELGIVTNDEVDEVLAELDALGGQRVVESMPRVVQAWGRAPAPEV